MAQDENAALAHIYQFTGVGTEYSRVSLQPSLQWIMAAAILVVTWSAFLFGRSRGHRPAAANSVSGQSARLWGELFQKDRDTFLVPADSGLVILEGLTRASVPLTQYAGGDYKQVPGAVGSGLTSPVVQQLSTRRYTSIVDLSLVSQISRLPKVVPERLLIRYARDLRMDDLRSSNAILLGSVDSNPWEELFEQQLNFRFQFDPKQDTAPVIENMHPLPGEEPMYANCRHGEWHNTFGIIAFVPNLSGTGHILIAGGLNMAGTQAAGDFLLNASLMNPVLERASRPDGTLRPFEILVTTDNIAANASRPHVVSERIGAL